MAPVADASRVLPTPTHIRLERGPMKTKRYALLGTFVTAALVLAISACGGGDDNKSSTTSASTTTTTDSNTVSASLGEYFIKLDKSSAPAGRVTFKVANDGKIKHEFVVIKTNLAPGKLPSKGGEADEEVGTSPGEIPSVAPGESKTLTVQLKPAKYVLICNLPGHYKAGQYTGINVK